VICCGLICYGWRALGVALSRGLDLQGPAVRWLVCVSYAMLAAVSARMIVLPSGALADTPDVARYVSCAAALAVFLIFRRNVLAGTTAGFATLVGFQYAVAAG